MKATMCRAKTTRKFRVRLDRIFGTAVIFIAIIVLFTMGSTYFSKASTKTSTRTSTTATATAVITEEFDTYTEASSDVETSFPLRNFVETERKTEHFDITLYTSDEVSKSEKNSMFKFFSEEYCKDFEPYYSQRLGRYVSSFEMYHLVRITYSEAGTQGENGKIAVAATILNRMEDTSGMFENRIYDVIFQKYQFSSADILDDARENAGKYFSGGIEQKYEDLDEGIKADCLTAVERALDGEDPTKEITGGALFFFNPDQCSEEELALRTNIPYDKIFIEEDHWFHREWPAA